MKPSVGVVFSDSVSLESRHVAHFLGALLFLGDYSSVRLVNFSNSGACTKESVAIIPPTKYAAVTVPASADFVLNADPSALKDSHLIILCVSSEDTAATAAWLSKILPQEKKGTKDPKCIVSLQHGCKNFDILTNSELSKGGHVLLDGSVGFHVFKSPKDGVLKMLIPGQLVVERLTKEKAEHGEKFVNLLCTTGIPIIFRKSLTPFTWGTMVFDCGLVVNGLTGDSFIDFVMIRQNRLVWAQMIRECSQAFTAASQASSWSPEGGASCALSLGILEQLLCLPTLLFRPVSWIFLGVALGAGSPIQGDLRTLDRRKTSGDFILRELTSVGSRYSVPMPVCNRILVLLRNAVKENNGVPSLQPADLISDIGISFGSTGRLLNSISLLLATAFGVCLLWVVLGVFLPREGL